MAVEGEFGGVVQHQDQCATGGDPLAGRLKMPAQNLFFADARVGEETVRRFGIGQILTRARDAGPDVIGELFQNVPQPPGVEFIVEPALRQFALDPVAGLPICSFPPLLLHIGSSSLCACLSEVLTLRPNLLLHPTRTEKSVLFVGN